MPVYFIRAVGGFGPVKIGCSEHPPARLDALMTYAPYPLEVVATYPGDYTVERRFHHMFREYHSHREWFKPNALLERVIEQITNGTFDVGVLPPPKSLVPSVKRNPWSPERREAFSLSSRLRCQTEEHGFHTPEEWRHALANYAELSERGRRDLKRMIEAHLADPIGRANPAPYKWAQKAHALYLEARKAA